MALSMIMAKSALFALLDEALAEGLTFCKTHDIDLQGVFTPQDTLHNLAQFNDFANKLLAKEERHKAFIVYENTISALYQACKPEILKKSHSRPLVFVFQYLRGVLESIIQRQDIEPASLEIAELLDESIIAKEKHRLIRETLDYDTMSNQPVWDLSTLDLDKFKSEFKNKPYKHIEITDLRALIEQKLTTMLRKNSTRTDFAQRLQEIIDDYNAGSSDAYFDELIEFSRALKEEETRHIREELSEAELELFDLLKKEKMSETEKQKVKLAAKTLLKCLEDKKESILVQEWHKDTQSQQRVRAAMEDILDKTLPNSYNTSLFKEKCNTVYDFIYERSHRDLPLAA